MKEDIKMAVRKKRDEQRDKEVTATNTLVSVSDGRE